MEAKLLIKGKDCTALSNGFWETVAAFASGLILERFKACWVKDRIPALGEDLNRKWCWMSSPGELSELEDYVAALNGVVVSLVKDRWLWSPDVSGKFSTNSFKTLAAEVINEEARYTVKGYGWVSSKCKIFIWRSVHDHIPTRQALEKRNIMLDSVLCVLCGEGVETVDHYLFTDCNISMRVWNRLSEWVKLPPIFAFLFMDLLDVHKGVGGDSKAKEIVRGLVVVTCWAIWKARNTKVFSNGRDDSDDIFGDVRSLDRQLFGEFLNQSKLYTINLAPPNL
ncbi:uncharacterized protein LOC110896794 [Helianthus annuus]|uniref:uncharacterized protein LOC110896794 n=1 Tax=Helianthus annuus TaxID=4232 RepID=UPI000B907D83|nr:uncharacterized protein LOC110896794 [Helianthus annuus]